MNLMPGSAAAPADGEPVAAAQVPEATARLLRSVRAGRAWVRERRAAPPSVHPACVTMKGGTGEPAVFMFPGVSGSIFQLGPIALALRIPMAVYAIKPRGFDDGQSPCKTIPEMAEYAIAAIRAVQPQGPYLLAGYSAGGLLALETAKQLSAAGDAVPLVVLFDTQLGRPSWPWDCHAELLWRAGIKSLKLLRRDRGNLKEELRQRLVRVRQYLAESGVTGVKAPPVALECVTPEAQRVYIATYNAGESYRPSRYYGKVLYLQPLQLDNVQPRSPSRMWRKYLPGLEVRRLPGSHMGMVLDDAGGVAAAIAEPLQQAAIAANCEACPPSSISRNGNRAMSVRSTILAQFEEVANEQGKTLAPLTDATLLLDSGLDSLCLAIIVARLEDDLGIDPFQTALEDKFPVTFGDFVKLYESGTA